MQSATDLDLPFPPIDSPEMGSRPASFFVETRKKHPWLARCKIARGPNSPTGDFLDDLIAANTSGGLSDDEFRIMLVFLFGAGYDTSKNLLTLIMNAVLERPEMWKRCAEDLAYCERVVEEALRYTSPINTMKAVIKPIEYRGVGLEPAAQDHNDRRHPRRDVQSEMNSGARRNSGY